MYYRIYRVRRWWWAVMAAITFLRLYLNHLAAWRTYWRRRVLVGRGGIYPRRRRLY